MYVPHVPPATGPASAGPVGVDASWRLPDRLRPTEGDLPALAWLIARRFTGGPHEGDVGRYRAAASLPLWLALLVVQHATGTLAARGRAALVVLTPTWPAAVVAHPCRRVLAAEVRRWAAGRHAAVAPEGRVVLATTLFGRGRPSIAAAGLGRDVLELADGRGWALLTNGGVPAHTAGQYARVGFAWLPDSTRRMLRPATGDRAWPRFRRPAAAAPARPGRSAAATRPRRATGRGRR